VPCYPRDSFESIGSIAVRIETSADDEGLSAFLAARARLLRVAYRVVKSAAEAEDIVQDVWIRWQATDRSTVRDAAAFLTTATRRLALNAVRSPRLRRESSVASPQEPADTRTDPESAAERREALCNAVRALLEKLSRAERAAYVLREAFDYSYREIANVLRVQEACARQLVARARQHVVDGQDCSVNSAQQRDFLAAFLAAVQKGALSRFESFLVGSGDGGVRKGMRPLRTRTTLTEPIAVLDRWPLLPELAAEVCVNAPFGVHS
jgi:RNA polymerase sigma-70 factor (ECF subfamily)